jgi:hypothetical protein
MPAAMRQGRAQGCRSQAIDATPAVQVSIARVYNFDLTRKRGLQKEGPASQR